MTATTPTIARVAQQSGRLISWRQVTWQAWPSDQLER
jgi:hypothetical protein